MDTTTDKGFKTSGDGEKEEQILLSTEQVEALKAVQEGKNVFITGSAGVGKSFLLNEILKSLKHSKVYVTASTGVAACNIGGTTFHSFAGIGLGTKPLERLAYEILHKAYKVEVKHRWLSCRVLIIDEISMIDGGLFSKVEHLARLVRKSDRPFGGIQLVLIGDFLQLPPVNVTCFAFETDAWKQCIDKTITLKKVFRQKLVGFVTLLNRLRLGRLTALDVDVLHECNKTKFSDDGIKPTRLFPYRAACDRINLGELNKLADKLVIFQATDWATDDVFREQLQKNTRFPQVLELKMGAQVMLLTNLSVKEGLVNGARGVVVGFKNRRRELEEEFNLLMKNGELDDEEDAEAFRQLLKTMSSHESYDGDGYPIVKFANGLERCITTVQTSIEIAGIIMAHRTQVPLALAWAVSIHKSQGLTLERVDINIANVFEHGQAYVALSRVTSLDGLLLRDFNPSRITAHPKVLEYYQKIDPTLREFSKQGEEELKGFIHRRRYPEKYAREIEEEKRKKREVFLRQEVERLQKIRESMKAAIDLCKAGVSVMEEHSYSKTESIEEANGNNKSVIDLTGDSPVITSKHFLEKTTKNAFTPSPQNISTPILNAKFTHITQPFTPQKVMMAASRISTSTSQISESLSKITFATPGANNNNVRRLNPHPTMETPVKLIKLEKECIDTSPGNSKYVEINGERSKLVSLVESETPIKYTSRVPLNEKSLFEACNSNYTMFNRQITELYQSGKASRSSTTKTKSNQRQWEDKTQSLNESNPSNISSKLNQSSSNEQVNVTHMTAKEPPKSNGQLTVGPKAESCPVTALEKAEEKLRLCKVALAELESQKTSERENNDTKYTQKKEIQILDNTTLPNQLNINTGRSSTDSGFYEETCGGEINSKLQEKNTQNGTNDENIAPSNVLLRNCEDNVTSAVESDPEELFDDNFDDEPKCNMELNQNSSTEKREQSEVTEHTPQIRRSSRNRKRKSFDDFITSDISNAKKSCPKDSLNIRNKSFNKENENVSAGTPDTVSENLAGKVTRKSVLTENRKVENWKAFQFKNSLDTSTNKSSSSGYSDRQIKQLLADKQDEINEKRRKALERRLSSLKRSQNSCK